MSIYFVEKFQHFVLGDIIMDNNIKERFSKLCEMKGVKKTAVAKELGFSRSSYSKWNTSKPTAETVTKLAEYFGVSEKFILTGEDDHENYYLNDEVAAIAQTVYERPEMKMLFDASRDVSKEDIEFVIQMVEKMKQK